MPIQDVFSSQYHASFEMLQAAVTRCPDAVWDDRTGANAFWRTAYHAAFYTHLYLQPTLADFQPWPEHRDKAERLPTAPVEESEGVEPYTREEVLTYLQFCHAQVDRCLPLLELDGPSGFWWKFSKLELQIYNIRHLQQHVGELYARLGVAGDGELPWIAAKTGA
ncbi:MAG: DinB family protein [Anaerolineae bacterium]